MTMIPKWRWRLGLSKGDMFIGVRWRGMKLPRSLGGKDAYVVSITLCPLPCLYLKVERALVNPDYVNVRRNWL